MKAVAGLFPGQGSQSVGMGTGFLQQTDLAKSLFAEADDALGFPLSKLCIEGPLEALTLTKNAQPAILAVSYISYSLSDIPLAAAAGHSLGEYTALVAAGCLPFAEAVALVHKRGAYMQEAVPEGRGKMLAVLGLSEEELRSAIASLQGNAAEIANLNSPGQIVVAGPAGCVDALAAHLQGQGTKAIALNVSAPFHCSLMQPAAEKLANDLRATSFSDPAFPVYSNVTAEPIESGSQACELLIRQVTNSVRWTDSIVAMLEQQKVECTVEFGAGGVLSKLMKRIDKSLPRYEAADPVSLQEIRDALD